ncbi:sulfotransferase domain-containing protein [Coraliomargarita parva]|uniref:sulfotransferase domain-containing protein n=1 Tax=Coraliomargarita parva TaxID=3014050 RepID=UPI0022B2F953|nr:sulfotransferase domain-containing protein [Coraliomargarita parva]
MFELFKKTRGPRAEADCLFHVTHAKAGSSWLYRIFKTAYDERTPLRVGEKIEDLQYQPGAIYSALFCDYPRFRKLKFAQKQPTFFVIRDIRDTLTSLYFSLKYSHVPNPNVLQAREEMKDMSDEEGLLHVFRKRSAKFLFTQSSWMESGLPVYRYEEIFESQGQMLIPILQELRFDFDADYLLKVIEQLTFEKEFGRKPGETDIHSHGRSGKPGSWKEYMTPELEEFIDTSLSAHIKQTNYPI